MYERFVQLMDNQKNCKIGWIANEFELFCNDFIKKRGLDFMITNFEEWGVKKAHTHNKYLMTNLNALQARERNPLIPTDKKYDVCYYGTYRKYRDPYFKKYMIKDMVLSTSTKNVKRFLLAGCEDCWLTDKFSWEAGNETLNLFRASLYIEDTKTHKLYNHLANRFYEGLYCNCAVFFDRNCENTILKSKYPIESWFIIDSYEELLDKLHRTDIVRLESFLNDNTIMALADKNRCLNEIQTFLETY
jgi:hypothetical protein